MPIPERPKEWKPRDAPDFVRFYMGEGCSIECVAIISYPDYADPLMKKRDRSILSYMYINYVARRVDLMQAARV